jgi:hypothetical protein
MELNTDYIAPCGLCCGVCGILYAALENNVKLKETLLGVYKGKLPDSENLSVEDIHCKGCLSVEPFVSHTSWKKGYFACYTLLARGRNKKMD